MMRALVLDGQMEYRDSHPEPRPAEGEGVVQVHLAGICATDLEMVRGYLGFRGVLGHEMVGTVVIGSPAWKGKRVAAEINCVCRTCDLCQSGLSSHCRRRTVLGIVGRDGCFADYVAVPERNLHEVPSVVPDEEAVFIEPLAAAYQVVKQVGIEPRMSVAVLGSGRLGLLVAQVLARTGCKLEVIGRNPKTLLLCEKRGIQSRSLEELRRQQDRDVVVECTGSAGGMEIALKLVRPRGTIVLKSTHAGGEVVNLSPAVIHEVTILGSRCGPFSEAIRALARREIEVSSMVSRVLRIDRGVEAFAAAADPEHLKVLLKINPR